MKKKETIKRKELKSSFLRQTIIRIDYDYMFDDYINEVMKNMDEYLGEKGYFIENKFISEFGLKVDFDKINSDLNASILDNIDVESDKREKYSSFINNDKQIKIDITKEYSAITIDYKEHIYFEELNEIFDKIVEELKKVRANLQIRRIGLRKNNVYMMKDLSNIESFFEKNIFNFASDNLESYKFFGKNSVDFFSYKGYKVNQTANITQGYIQSSENDELVYQLILDIDVYNDILTSEVMLEDMNDRLFEIYKNSLKEEFLNKLLSKNFKDGRIFKI